MAKSRKVNLKTVAKSRKKSGKANVDPIKGVGRYGKK